MPATDDDIETRLTIVERDVAQLREDVALTNSDAAAARVLAAGADHDVSKVRAELRAHTQALNAPREIQGNARGLRQAEPLIGAREGTMDG